jgi:hypothetical protein
MTAGGVPKKKAIAKATSDNVEESSNPFSKDYKSQIPDEKGSKTGHKHKKTSTGDVYTKKASKETPTKESAKSCNHTMEGKMCPVHGKKECPKMESVVAEKADKKAKNPFAVGMAAAKKEAGIKKTPAKDLPKKVVKKGHEIGKSIKKSQKDESINVFRRNVRLVNESLQYLINEDEEEKAQAITSASDMANDFTSWMQRVGQYQTKVMIELSDEIRHNFGPTEAEAFKQAVAPALAATLETLTSQREIISGAIAALAGGQVPEPMGAAPTPEMPVEPTPALSEPDTMNEPNDEFAASDAAAGAGASGREMRESSFMRKLAESHSIMSKLAK